ncbi:MAG: nucleotidyltransferase domain-containing protein [Clostridiales bacterium]|jgi:predicted nucleotidyltransferase|nr:nucleotidyltransferase domain-containing protein [Clostridiales bacterium]
MTQEPDVVQQIIKFVISKISPERIILFGSYARGDSSKSSDIDILILIKNLVNERRVTSILYKELLQENISVSVDFLAVDYDNYEIVKNKIGYIYETIDQEGKVLYEK